MSIHIIGGPIWPRYESESQEIIIHMTLTPGIDKTAQIKN
jgi:hypothetical protein